MSTVTPPTVEHVAQALLVVSGPKFAHSVESVRQFAASLLPNTPINRGIEAILGITGHLEQAAIYAAASPEMARQWFGDCACDDNSAAAMAECLHERSIVWAGEAETLALTAAMLDRTTNPAASWAVPV